MQKSNRCQIERRNLSLSTLEHLQFILKSKAPASSDSFPKLLGCFIVQCMTPDRIYPNWHCGENVPNLGFLCRSPASSALLQTGNNDFSCTGHIDIVKYKEGASFWQM